MHGRITEWVKPLTPCAPGPEPLFEKQVKKIHKTSKKRCKVTIKRSKMITKRHRITTDKRQKDNNDYKDMQNNYKRHKAAAKTRIVATWFVVIFCLFQSGGLDPTVCRRDEGDGAFTCLCPGARYLMIRP